MEDSKLRKVYDTIVKEGYDVPDFATFETDMRDDNKLTQVRDRLVEDGYELPEFGQFKIDMFGAPQPQEATPQQGFFAGVKEQIADTAKQAVQKPNAVEYPTNPVEFQAQVDQEERAIAERLPQANAAMSQRMLAGQTTQGAFNRFLEGDTYAKKGTPEYARAKMVQARHDYANMPSEAREKLLEQMGGKEKLRAEFEKMNGRQPKDEMEVYEWMTGGYAVRPEFATEKTDVNDIAKYNGYSANEINAGMGDEKAVALYTKDILSPQLKAAQERTIAMLKERDAEIEAANREREAGMPWYVRAGANMSKGGTAGMPSYVASNNGRYTDQEWKMLSAAANINRETEQLVDAAVNDRNGWTAFGRTITNIDTWFPLMSGLEMSALMELKNVDPEKASPAQKALMEALAMRVAAESAYSGDISNWYKMGEGVAQMIPLMAEMAVNPLSSVGKAAAKKTLRETGKRLWAYGAHFLGSLAGGAGMAATTSLPRVAVNAGLNSMGQAQYNINAGDIEFDSMKPGGSYWSEFGKEFARTAIEHGTEQMGAGWLTKAIGKPLKWAGKGVSKIPGVGKAVKRTEQFLEDALGEKYELLKNLAKDVKYDGPLEEFGEEFESALMRVPVDGWDSLKEFFDGDNLLVTLGTVVTPFASGVTLAGGYNLLKGGYKAGAREYGKQQAALRRAEMAFGENQEALKNITFNLNNADTFVEEMRSVYDSKELTNEQKFALLEYGVNTLKYMAATGSQVDLDENTQMLNGMLRESYGWAYENTAPEAVNGNMVVAADKALREAESAVKVALGLQSDTSIEDFVGNRSVDEVAMGDDAVAEALRAYYAEKALFEGMQDKMQDTRENEYMEADKSVDAVAHKEGDVYSGNIYRTTLPETGETIFITGGKVVLDNEGYIDVNQSEGLVALMPNSKKEAIQAGNIRDKVIVENAQAQKAAKRAEIDARYKQQLNTFTYTDKADGTEHTVQLVSRGEQMARVVLDGVEQDIPNNVFDEIVAETTAEASGEVEQAESGEVKAENTESGDIVSPVETAQPELTPKQKREEVAKRIPMKGKERAWTEAEPADVVEYISLLTEDPAKQQAAVDKFIADIKAKQEKADAITALEMDEDIAFWEGVKQMLAEKATPVAEVAPVESAPVAEEAQPALTEGENNADSALQNGDNELNLQKENVSDDANTDNTSIGGQVPESVPQGEYREVTPLSGGVQEAAARLRERIEGAQGDSKSGLREVENRVTREFAQENGLWIDDEFKLGVPFPSGDEHNNYIDAENQVVYKVNNRMHTPSILELLDRMEQHNKLFPNTQYRLVGFTAISKNGDVMPVFAQDFVPEARMATTEEIEGYMSNAGFSRVGDGRYSNGEVVVKDLKPRNVLVDPNGDVYVVDAEFENPTEASSSEIPNSSTVSQVSDQVAEGVGETESGEVKTENAVGEADVPGQSGVQQNESGKMYSPEELAEAKEQLGELNATSAPEFAARLFSIKPWKTLEEANAALKELLASYGETLNGQSLAVMPFLDKAQGLIREYNKSQESRSTEDKEVAAFDKQAEIAKEREQRAGVAPRPGHLAVAIGEGNEKAVEEWKVKFDSYLQKLNADDLPTIDATIKGMQGRKKDIRKMKKDGYKDDSIYKAYDYIETALKKRAAELKKVSATEQPKQEKASQGERSKGKTENVSKQEVEKIEDVGEKIGGAKKDRFAEGMARIKAELGETDETLMGKLAKLPVSQVFNFDLEKLREGGISNEAISFIKIVKDYLPAKPRKTYKIRNWVNNTLALYKLCLEAGTNWDRVNTLLNGPQFTSSSLKEQFDAYMAIGGFDSGMNIGNAALRQLDNKSGRYDESGKFVTLAGKWYVRDAGKHGGIYDTKEEAVNALKAFAGDKAGVTSSGKKKEVKFAVYQRRQDKSIFIAVKGKSDIVIQDGFKSSKEAFDYIEANNAELQERYRALLDKTNADFEDNRPREGRDYRDGKDIPAEEFRTTFGFRGVEFGNWMTQEDRRKALNECYDALMDLAAVCKVSPQALSLGGTLGMAFGARGGGRFSAHYEPGKLVINLTKTKGAGSLAHEWFHALDNYFAKMGSEGLDVYATAGEGLFPEGISSIGKRYYDRKSGQMLTEEEYNERMNSHEVRREMADAWKSLMETLKKSDYYKRSAAYAGLHNSNYWSRPTELGARAFSTWVENELSKQGASNDYLANNPRFLVSEATDEQSRFMPYPFDADATWMEEAFGNLFEVMQEKTTEDGKVVLYNIADEMQMLKDRGTEAFERATKVTKDAVERLKANGLDIKVVSQADADAMAETASGAELMTAFHGTGAKFDRFDHSFMSTGEGAQAYGWGTYVTEVEGIGRTYAEAIGGWAYKGKKRADERTLYIAKRLLDEYGGYDEVLAANEGVELSSALKKAVEFLKSTGKDAWEGNYYLYEVEIPDDNGANYLYWDRPVDSAVVERVADGLRSVGFEVVPDMEGLVFERAGRLVALSSSDKGSALYADLENVLGSDKAASEFLSEQGFVGISYPANATTGGRADGARNYTIFKEEDAEIRGRKRKDGVYGWAVDGKIRLAPDGINPDTPVHEYAHLWGAAVEKNNPKLWNEVVEAMKLSPVWNEVAADSNYSNIHGNDSRMASEVLARLSGRENYRRAMKQAEKEIAGANGVFEKAEKVSAWAKVQDALRKFWDWVQRNVFKRGERSNVKAESESADVMSWEEFANSVIGDFYEGKNPNAEDEVLYRSAEDNEARAISYDEAVQIGNDFANTHKGAAPTITIVSIETLEDRLRDAGFSDEDIEDAKKDFYEDLAYYHPKYDVIVINRHDVSKEELIGYLWHENAHRAVGKLYTSGEMERVFNAIYGARAQEIREALEKAGYKPLEHAEESIVSGIEESYLDETTRSRLENGGWKAKKNATEEQKNVVEFINRVINFINNGEEQGVRGRRGRTDNTDAGENAQETARRQDVEMWNSQNTGETPQEATGGLTEEVEERTLFKKELTPEQKKKQEDLKENAKKIRQLHNAKANASLTALRNLRYVLETDEEKALHDELFAQRDAIIGEGKKVIEMEAPKGMTLKERITESLLKLAGDNNANVDARLAAIRALNNDMANVLKLMRVQKEYDRNTVAMFTGLVKQYLRNNAMKGMSSYDIMRLLGLMQRATGGYRLPVYRVAVKIADIITKEHTRQLEEMMRRQMKTGAEKVNASGVVVQGGVDIVGKRVLNAYQKAIEGDDAAKFEEDFANAVNRVVAEEKMLGEIQKAGKDTKSVEKRLQELRAELDAMTIARVYREEVAANKDDIEKLIGELRDKRAELDKGNITRREYNEFADKVNELIVTLRAQQIDAYQKVVHALGGDISEGMKRAKEFREAEVARVQRIHDMVEGDMNGVSKSAEREKRGIAGKTVDMVIYKNPLVRTIMSGTGTYEQYMKYFGRDHLDGRGALFEHFMTAYHEAHDKQWRESQNDFNMLDAQSKQIFGKDYKKIARESTKPSGVILEYWNGGKKVSRELTIGQLMYIYMTEKQTEGSMKLRNMGLTEEIVANAVAQLPAKYKQFADYIQAEFLPMMRPRINEVHQRMFGASMSEVENYFPLVVNKDARNGNYDLNNATDILPSTVTGSIIKRRVNVTPLNLEANAFDVLNNHIVDMEHWAAYAEFTRDNNTLLSDKDFMNRVKNTSSVRYGNGEILWEDFVETARIATDSYRGRNNVITKLMRGANAAKITFGYFTALKQLASMPAFWSDAKIWDAVWYAANPMGSWKWAIDNLPGFEERWKGRTGGNERLEENEYSIHYSRIMKAARMVGLTPNAFIDAIVVASGARAVYKDKLRFYKAVGMTEYEADKRAKRDAAISYNETQQSGQGAYLSTLQKSGGLDTLLLTLFRNSQMAFQRRVVGSIADIGKKLARGEKVREATKQKYVEMGMSEEAADKKAFNDFCKAYAKDITNLVIFGYGMNYVWYLMGELPYLLLGDDEEEKEKIMDGAAKMGFTGMFEGLSLGGYAKGLYEKGVSGGKYGVDMLVAPFETDLELVLDRFEKDGTMAGVLQLANFAIEMNSGISPQRLIDDVAAIIDFSNGDIKTAADAQLLALRLMKVPQSQIDKLILDETHGASAEEVQNIAERYIEYKMNRNFPFGSEDEKRVDKYANKFVETLKERVEKEYNPEDISVIFDKSSDTEKEILKKKWIEGMDERNGTNVAKSLRKEKIGELLGLPIEKAAQKALHGITKKTPYEYLETFEDLQEFYEIKSKQNELEPLIEEHKKQLEGKSEDEQYALYKKNEAIIEMYKALKEKEQIVSNYKKAMEGNPEKADEYMNNIRELRSEAIDLINNYNE